MTEKTRNVTPLRETHPIWRGKSILSARTRPRYSLPNSGLNQGRLPAPMANLVAREVRSPMKELGNQGQGKDGEG